MNPVLRPFELCRSLLSSLSRWQRNAPIAQMGQKGSGEVRAWKSLRCSPYSRLSIIKQHEMAEFPTNQWFMLTLDRLAPRGRRCLW